MLPLTEGLIRSRSLWSFELAAETWLEANGFFNAFPVSGRGKWKGLPIDDTLDKFPRSQGDVFLRSTENNHLRCKSISFMCKDKNELNDVPNGQKKILFWLKTQPDTLFSAKEVKLWFYKLPAAGLEQYIARK